MCGVHTSNNPQSVDFVNNTNGRLRKNEAEANCAAMASDALYVDIGHRLEAIRRAFSEDTQKEWADRHGFSPTQYNNWERGLRRIPVECAERLCDIYGLTLDFMYRGRRDGLSENASKSV